MSDVEGEAVRAMVRESYGKVAADKSSCCVPSCCGGGAATATETPSARDLSEKIGYAPAELDSVPEEANLGLGCGNPTAIAALREGEVVVDLGAGAGLDAFLAAARVGPTGRVIGVDMTPEMLARARENAVRAGLARNVEFREGIIEELPVASGSADVVISNCVINLSADKERVFREAFRVLRPGGRLAVSDILLTEPLPEEVRGLAAAYVACVGGAMVAADYLAAIERAGFVDVRTSRTSAALLYEGFAADPTIAAAIDAIGRERVSRIAGTVYSYRIEARKP